jgi:diguanylate cyclase (GGDEF)-like protein
MDAAQNQILNSPFLDQRERGFRRLRFSNFVEEEFRQYYSNSSLHRARMILAFAIGTVLFMMGAGIADDDSTYVMPLFYGVVMLPTLLATLYVSILPGRHRLFQLTLAFSAFLVGLIVASVVSQASLIGNAYYFGALVTWIFVDWLILGMPFRHAARTASLVSVAYVWGLFNWNFPPNEVAFSIALLLFTNFVAAFCCFQLERAIRKSFLESKALGQLAERDGLTGLYNRRSYDEYVQRIWRQSRREQTQISILMIDIDHFKKYNDLYGHQAGDDALRNVAAVIAANAQRPLDFAARFGGEEFSLILYGPANEYGRQLPEIIRSDVRDLRISHKGSTAGPYLTVSIGIAIVTPGGERSLAGAIQMADEALYQAKADGRDGVVLRESMDTQVQTGNFRTPKKLPV